jgi:hypothetical protein
MSNRIVLIFMIILLLAGCGPTEEEIQIIAQTAIAETQIAKPTPTNIPFSELDLESIIIVSGDLPAGFSAAQVTTLFSETGYNSAPDYFISQGFSNNGEVGGSVKILIFEIESDAKSAYTVSSNIVPGENKESVELGESGLGATFDLSYIAGISMKGATVAFKKCNAVVYIQFIGTTNLRGVIAYGNRLDSRLEPFVCR